MLTKACILLAFAAGLIVTDRVVAGYVQCRPLGCLPGELR